MRMRFVAATAAFAVALVGSSAAPAARSLDLRASCGAGYVPATLPWGHKCLRTGEFCKVGNPAYRQYGYVCPSTGHLRRR